MIKEIVSETIDENEQKNIISYKKHFLKFYQTWPTTPVFHWSESDDNSFKHAKKVINAPVDLGLDCIYEMEYKDKDKGFQHLLPKTVLIL